MDRPEDRLALIECFERDGRAARVLDVWQWPVTLGRAMDNDVVIDDPFVAAHHLRLQPAPGGGVLIVVLDTHNGVRVGGVQHAAGARVPLPSGGATLQVGAGLLRVRLPGEALTPEKRLPTLSRWDRLAAPALTGALALLVGADHVVGLDPGADATAWLPLLVGLPTLLVGWCALWALMSKLFRHRFDFAGHLRTALPWLLAMQLASLLVPQLGAMFGWPLLWQLTWPLQVLLGALLVRAHLLLVLPSHGRSVSAAVGAAVLLGSAISLTLTYRATDRYTRAPYMSTLPMPALNLSTFVAPATLVTAMEPLAETLAARVRKARKEEAEDEAAD